jgi:hypothetical protein
VAEDLAARLFTAQAALRKAQEHEFDLAEQLAKALADNETKDRRIEQLEGQLQNDLIASVHPRAPAAPDLENDDLDSADRPPTSPRVRRGRPPVGRNRPKSEATAKSDDAVTQADNGEGIREPSNASEPAGEPRRTEILANTASCQCDPASDPAVPPFVLEERRDRPLGQLTLHEAEAYRPHAEGGIARHGVHQLVGDAAAVTLAKAYRARFFNCVDELASVSGAKIKTEAQQIIDAAKRIRSASWWVVHGPKSPTEILVVAETWAAKRRYAAKEGD